MKKRMLTLAILFQITATFAQIDNVQFKELKGKQYDLYQLLSKGKHVIVHTQFNS